MKIKFNSKKNRVYIAFILLIVSLVLFYSTYNRLHFEKLATMNGDEYLASAVGHLDEDSLITIGIYNNGKKEIKHYNKNGQITEDKESDKIDYEIGSINKTMTADIIYRLEKEGKLNVDDSINKYIEVEEGTYPTIKNLLTHTGGYKSIYRDSVLHIGNPMANFSNQNALKVINKNKYYKQSNFSYSNFGYATLGLVIENITNRSYEEIFQKNLKETFGLSKTKLSNKSERFNNKRLFDWGNSSFYKPAGAAISNVDDMLIYLEKTMNQFKSENKKYIPLRKGDTNLNSIKSFGINFNAVSYGWLIDTEKRIWAHPGELPTSSAFIAFNPDKEIGIIVLINQGMSNDTSSKFLGAKLINELIDKK